MNRVQFDLKPPTLNLQTTENVTLSIPIASVLLRSGAYFIDLIIQLILIGLSISGFIPLVASGSFNQRMTLIIAIFLWILLIDGYFIIFETLWRGQSPGKRLLGIRVVRMDGGTITWREALIRQLFRYLDFLPAFYAAGVASIMISPYQQRLGDRMAGTILTTERKRTRMPGTEIPILPAFLPEDERYFLHELLVRSASLAPDVRDQLAREFLHYLTQYDPTLMADATEHTPHAFQTLQHWVKSHINGATS